MLGAQLAPAMSEPAPKALLFALTMWLGGSMLYIWIISLIFYRYTFFALSPNDLAPPYWINMGAAAIATLAVLGACSSAGAPTQENPVTVAPPVAEYNGPAPANADLDCDGLLSTFERYGYGDESATRGECSMKGSSAFFKEGETE